MRRYIGVLNHDEKRIEFYSYDETFLRMCASMSNGSIIDYEYCGDIHKFYIIQNDGIIPVTNILISNFPVEKLPGNTEDLFYDVVEHAKQIEYLKYVDTDEKRINYTIDKSHKSRVGNLSLELMFDDKIVEMFERGELLGYFNIDKRTIETDNLINSFLNLVPAKKIANWLLTDACSALVETYTKHKEHISLDDLHRNVKTATTIVYDPSFDGTLQSYINIQEKYQELNLI